MKTEQSESLFQRCSGVVPGGVHSNFRAPIYFRTARGSRIWDVDGNEYIDYMVGNGACILGHADRDIESAVLEAVRRGLTAGLESELSLSVAIQLRDMIPCAERVRFANTGTEAVMKALMIARAFTGKVKIIKVEGGYHGWFDEAQVSVHPDPALAGPARAPRPVLDADGFRPNTLDCVLVVPFNDAAALEEALEKNREKVAAVLIEPVMFNCGCVLPKHGYLSAVRELTRRHRVVLIFDEVITGFRLAPGGAQERFGVIPDLAVFAKAIANGYPLSAVVGRGEMMDLSRPGGRVLYGGTYNGQYVVLAAAAACLAKLRDGAVQRRLQAATRRLSEGFAEYAQALGLAARLEECGGQFQVFFVDRGITNYRDAQSADSKAFSEFQRVVLREGIWMHRSYLFHHGVTFAHSDADLDAALVAFNKGLRAVKAERT